MTLNELSQYQSLIKEIAEEEDRIDKLRDKEVTTVAGKVKSSMAVFPFTEIRVSVEMEDPGEVKAKNDRILIKEQKIKKARVLSIKIEKYISEIEDSETRRIFELYFLNTTKLSQQEVADMLGMERSNVSKRIKKQLQLSHNSQN